MVTTAKSPLFMLGTQPPAGASGQNNNAANAQAAGKIPGYLGGGQNMVFPQAMPGQLGAIADQLSAGFGQPASSFMSQMDAIYAPTKVPFNAPNPAAANRTYTFKDFPWQKYIQQFPELRTGQGLDANRKAAWQHYAGQGGKWKFGGQLAPTGTKPGGLGAI